MSLLASRSVIRSVSRLPSSSEIPESFRVRRSIFRFVMLIYECAIEQIFARVLCALSEVVFPSVFQ